MNVERGKTEFSDEELAQLRRLILDYKGYEEKAWPALAKLIGIPEGTLQPWAKGNYAGDNQRVAAAVHRFLKAEEDRLQLELEAPIVPGFLPTKTAHLLHAQFDWAHRGRITIAVGAAGVGKTAAMRQYQANRPNVWLVTMTAACKTPTTLLQEILFTLGSPERRYGMSLQAAFHTVVDRLAGARALLLCDEAQHLRDDALDMLRQVHDACGVGVALCGNETVSSRIQGTTRRAAFAQLYSRVSNITRYDAPRAEDIALLLNAWEVTQPRAREFLTNLAMQPGCLRTVTQVLEQATLMARQEGEDRSLDHMKAAWSLHARQPGKAA